MFGARIRQAVSIELFLERWAWGTPDRIPIAGDVVRLGRGEENDVVLVGDVSVSRNHAVLEATAAGWTLTDLASHNGTFLNGERITTPVVCGPGDELRLGRTRLVFGQVGQRASTTKAYDPGPVPKLTPRQRTVLVELCRPALNGSVLDDPAGVPELAAALFVSESAIKKQLSRMYDVFDFHEPQRNRRHLAAEVIRRGVVSRRDLGPPSE